MSTPDRLESIFYAALEKAAPEDRAAYLAEACGKDASLRARIEQMLAAQEGSFLNSPPEGLAATEAHQGTPAPSFIPPLPSELASRFPQLEILELVGQGGMGAVYKARQPGLDRLVALKILPPNAGRDPAFAERFSREARALARLSHPHIVNVYDFGQTDGQFYLVMEFVDGVNLRQAIRTESVSPKTALEIVAQVCDALQFAHDEGVVHRDIKPENILLDRRGRVKIADFGLAKLLGADGASGNLTGTHQVMGTLRYMAPEQMEGSRDVDHRADIYSLGVVFYELLTGEVPMGRFQPPSAKVQVDVRIDEVVLKSLEREPERRYQHASEVKVKVEAISGLRGTAPFTRQREVDDREVRINADDPDNSRTQIQFPFVVVLVFGLFLLGRTLQTMSSSIGTTLFTQAPFEHLKYWFVYVVPTLAVILGAMKAIRLSSYRYAVAAGVLIIISPVGLADVQFWWVWWLRLVFGIWALVLLSRPEIKRAFAIRRRDVDRATTRPLDPSLKSRAPSDSEIVAGAVDTATRRVVQITPWRVVCACSTVSGLALLGAGLGLLNGAIVPDERGDWSATAWWTGVVLSVSSGLAVLAASTRAYRKRAGCNWLTTIGWTTMDWALAAACGLGGLLSTAILGFANARHLGPTPLLETLFLTSVAMTATSILGLIGRSFYWQSWTTGRRWAGYLAVAAVVITGLAAGGVSRQNQSMLRMTERMNAAFHVWTVFEQGQVEHASEVAEQYLADATRLDGTMNYGHAIHDANSVLGMVALYRGDIHRAKRRLIAAGSTPEVPNLNFGRGLYLPMAMLRLGERELVRDYWTRLGSLPNQPPDSKGRWDVYLKSIENGGLPGDDEMRQLRWSSSSVGPGPHVYAWGNDIQQALLRGPKSLIGAWICSPDAPFRNKDGLDPSAQYVADRSGELLELHADGRMTVGVCTMRSEWINIGGQALIVGDSSQVKLSDGRLILSGKLKEQGFNSLQPIGHDGKNFPGKWIATASTGNAAGETIVWTFSESLETEHEILVERRVPIAGRACRYTVVGDHLIWRRDDLPPALRAGDAPWKEVPAPRTRVVAWAIDDGVLTLDGNSPIEKNEESKQYFERLDSLELRESDRAATPLSDHASPPDASQRKTSPL